MMLLHMHFFLVCVKVSEWLGGTLKVDRSDITFSRDALNTVGLLDTFYHKIKRLDVSYA